MSDLPVPVATAAPPAPEIVALPPDVPDITELFTFMRDAELRVSSLRMQIRDRVAGSTGEIETLVDVWLRHPGQAKVVSRVGGVARDGESGGATGARYDAWVGDGVTVQRLDAGAGVLRSRPAQAPPVGAERPDLPVFARLARPRTPLPAGSLAETFVHPAGICRNVLTSGRMSFADTRTLACGRLALVIRCDAPRSTAVLADRPDHWLEVGVDRETGMILLLVEHVGDQVTRHAEAVSFEPDAAVTDGDFAIHASGDIRRLY